MFSNIFANFNNFLFLKEIPAGEYTYRREKWDNKYKSVLSEQNQQAQVQV